MPARTTIDRDAIIQAALALIGEGGWNAVSARSIASRLGASTMPIYSAIGSMEELRRAAFVAAALRLSVAQRKPRTGNEALDLAVGYVAFAREEPGLFRFILANQKDIGDAILAAAKNPDAPGAIGDIALLNQVLGSLSKPERRDDFVLRCWIFTHGLAELVADGTLVMDEQEITRHLQDAGGAFYLYEQQKEERA
jgi:AcrR family transcriptional regulator